MKDKSKTNKKGETHFAGCLRHKEVECCPVNAAAELLILSMGKEPKRHFHQSMFDPRNDWVKDNSWLVTDETGLSPLDYSKKRSASSNHSAKKTKVSILDDSVGMDSEPLYHYEEFQKLIQCLDLEFCKVTHMRSMGCRYGQRKGAHKDELELLGRWIDQNKNSICQKHYLSNLVMEAMLPMAGFKNPKNGGCAPTMAYKLPRGRSINIGDIVSIKSDRDFCTMIDYIMPECIPRAERAYKAFVGKPLLPTDPMSMSNHRFGDFVVAATCAWIQDAVLMTEKYPLLLHRKPYKWLLEKPEVWNRIIIRVKQSCQESLTVNLDQVAEDRRVMIAHFDNVSEKLLSESSQIKDDLNDLKDIVTKPTPPQQHFHQILESMCPTGIKVVYQNSTTGQIITSPSSMLGSTNQQSNPSNHNIATVQPPTQATIRNNIQHQSTQQPATTTNSTTYTLRKVKDHKPEYIKSMVMEWHNIIIPTIIQPMKSNGLFRKGTWYAKGQKQLKEKYELLYDTINNAKYTGDITNLNKLQLLIHKYNELQNLLDTEKGDVETLCRKVKQEKKLKNEDKDIFDVTNIKAVILSRKEKQQSKSVA